MATKKYTVQQRRKREEKTNYRRRLKLLSSQKPRLIVRKYSKMILLQVIEFSPKGDKVICAFNSTQLDKFGWTGNKGNIPAAYLTGLHLAKKCPTKEVVVDIGAQHSSKGNVIYAAIKGAIDGGLELNCSAEMFPTEDRITGQHTTTKDLFSQVKPKIVGEKIE